jgi:Rha family phage regulatory protein
MIESVYHPFGEKSIRKDGIFMQKPNQSITSQEVSEMVGKRHSDLLRDIHKYDMHFNERKIASVDFWTESSYVDGKGEQRPCYLITKKGCEFIANKLTGKKGTEFTARYVNRFHQMESQLLLLEAKRPTPPAIPIQTETTPKKPRHPDIPLNYRVHIMDLIANCSKDALPYLAALAKPLIEDGSVPEPESIPELIAESETPSDAINLDRSSPAGWKTSFDRLTLKKEMRKININTSDLSVLSGISDCLLYDYLAGRVSPGYENRGKICKALGKPNTWLDGGAI